MSSYRKFWVWPKRKGEIFGSILANEDFEVAINEHCLENSFQVIELAALEACQKRLDEACELLTKARKTKLFECCTDDLTINTCEACEIDSEIDTFLNKIKTEIKDEGKHDN